MAEKHPGFPLPPIARKHCRHYSYKGGMIDGGPRCAAGVDNTKPCGTFPCMPDAKIHCPSREEWTEAERGAFVAAVKASMERAALVYAALPEKKPGTAGEIACPACGSGIVSFGWARNNGHLHAQCSTPGCFGVIQ